MSQRQNRVPRGDASVPAPLGTESASLISTATVENLVMDMSGDSMTGVRGAHSRHSSTKESGHAAPSSAQANFPHPSAGGARSDTPLSFTSELNQTWIQLAKTFVLIFPIYALGYFEFSFSWLLIGLAIFFWWRRHTGGKHSRVSRAFAFFEQAERSVTQSLTSSDLPPWVRALY